jgi:hypothetical protein
LLRLKEIRGATVDIGPFETIGTTSHEEALWLEQEALAEGQLAQWPYQIVAAPAVGGALVDASRGTRDSRCHAPEHRFSRFVPDKPYCTNHLGRLVIRSRQVALQYRHIQLNGPMEFRWMTFDVDRAAAYEAADVANLKPPHFVAVNPSNGHAHLGYLLSVPVLRFPESRIKPLAYFASVERGYRRRLGADPGYAGLIAKNPWHPDWRTEWHAVHPYSLEDLDAELEFHDKRPEQVVAHEVGAGRNVTVFKEARKIAYREAVNIVRVSGRVVDQAKFAERVIDIARGLNQQFVVPMRDAEVRGIGRSIAKWVTRRFTAEEFSRIQSWRGRQGSAKRWADHKSVEATKPWEAEGVSRRTWYRRKKSAASA